MEKESNKIISIEKIRVAKMKKVFAEFMQSFGSQHEGELDKRELVKVRGSVIEALLIHGPKLEKEAWNMDIITLDPFVHDDAKIRGGLVSRRDQIVAEADEEVKKSIGVKMFVNPDDILRSLIAERLVRADMAQRREYRRRDWESFNSDPNVKCAGNMAIAGVFYCLDKYSGGLKML